MDSEENMDSIESINGGFCVKRLNDEYCVDVLDTPYNWRVVLSPRLPEPHRIYDAGWCYFGHGVDEKGVQRTKKIAFEIAVLAAMTWDGTGEPLGYDKRVGK